MQLCGSDIDGEDEARAVREQHFGEAAGRCADIDADVILDIERVLLQRRRELDATARHPRMRWLGPNLCVGGN